MKLARPALCARGFSLVEVMVALLVISVGLLGIAKMQALAMSSTGGAKMRSIAAIQAAGLAAALHGDRSYWASVDGSLETPFVVDIKPKTFTATQDTRLATTPECTTAPGLDGVVTCETVDMAAYDLHQWYAGLGQQLRNPEATVTCFVPGAGLPLGCVINIQWEEDFISPTAERTTDQTALDSIQKPSYTLYVQP